MASAFLTRDGWVADFRALHGASNSGRVRVPAERLIGPADKAGAVAFAQQLDRLCRLCEATPTPAIIAEAEDARAITPEQAQALRTKRQVPGRRPIIDRRPTVLAAALMHPASLREGSADQERHTEAVAGFCRWAGIERVEDLTIDLVTSYLAHLRAQGYSYDGRRHALLWLRRASKMAAAVGLPDPLSRLALDRRDARQAIQAWSLPQLRQAIAVLGAHPDQRLRAVLLLGAFAGMRDSEIIRRQVRDLQGERLDIATDPARKAKNEASRRMIPLAPAIVEALGPIVAGRAPEAPLIATTSARSHRSALRGFFNPESFAKWFSRGLWPAEDARPPAWIDTGLPRLPPKTMRKSFLSWMARAKANRDHLERYTGHTLSGVAVVTARHYLVDYAATELEDIAELVERELSAPIHGLASTAPQVVGP